MAPAADSMHSVDGQVVWNCCGHAFTQGGGAPGSHGYSTSTVCAACLSGANYHPKSCGRRSVEIPPPAPPQPGAAPPDSNPCQGGPTAGSSYGALAEERASIYGDPEQSHISIGLAWEAVFRNRYQWTEKPCFIPQGQMFPAELVALMLAAFKLVRASRPTFHLDSYEDMVVYFKEFSQQWRQRDADK